MKLRPSLKKIWYQTTTNWLLSYPLVENLPHLFFLKRWSIVAPEAVPVTNNLPRRVREHFCQEVKGEAGVCQKNKAGVR